MSMLKGRVKQGCLQQRMVAVKKLSALNDLSSEKFLAELNCLKKVKHRNIVRFIGYCADTRGEVMEFEGKTRVFDDRHMLLCFEYVPNGNLQHYLEGIKVAT